jgi:hypothetical protein
LPGILFRRRPFSKQSCIRGESPRHRGSGKTAKARGFRNSNDVWPTSAALWRPHLKPSPLASCTLGRSMRRGASEASRTLDFRDWQDRAVAQRHGGLHRRNMSLVVRDMPLNVWRVPTCRPPDSAAFAVCRPLPADPSVVGRTIRSRGGHHHCCHAARIQVSGADRHLAAALEHAGCVGARMRRAHASQRRDLLGSDDRALSATPPIRPSAAPRLLQNRRCWV